MLKKALAIALALIVLFPLLYTLSLSLFTARDFNVLPARFFTSEPHFANFLDAVSRRYFITYSLNSIITSFLASFIRTVVIILSSYAFSFLRFKGKKAILFVLLLSAFIPQDSLLYQNYVTVSRLHLINTYAGIIATSLFSATQLMMLLAAMKSLSRDTFDASRTDGANDIAILYHIIIPLTKSIILTIFIQTFISVFNAYLWPLLVTQSAGMRTIQVGISLMGYQDDGRMGELFAAMTVTLMPFVALVIASRKMIIKALTNSLSY